MKYKSVLIDQIKACYKDKSWISPLKEILIDISAMEATWKNESNQSIWSLVNHLIFWNEKWLERFNVEQVELDNTINNDDTFYVNPNAINDEKWKETINKLETVFNNWIKVLEECDDSKLDTEIPTYFNAPWWGVVSNLCIHNAFHIGQIVLIKNRLE